MEHDNIRILKVSVLQANTKLPQSSKHQSRSQEIADSIPARGNYLAGFIFFFPMLALLTSYPLERTWDRE